MKIKNYLWTMLTTVMAVVVSISFVACGDDDDGGDNSKTVTENDPPGTIIANLTNTFYHDAKYGYNGITIMGHYSHNLGMNELNNLEVHNWNGDYVIVSLGKVKGLSNIKKVPESGWTKQVAAVPGFGYIFRMGTEQYQYARIYAVDYMTSTTGGIMGITIKYQENWKPDDK